MKACNCLHWLIIEVQVLCLKQTKKDFGIRHETTCTYIHDSLNSLCVRSEIERANESHTSCEIEAAICDQLTYLYKSCLIL